MGRTAKVRAATSTFSKAMETLRRFADGESPNSTASPGLKSHPHCESARCERRYFLKAMETLRRFHGTATDSADSSDCESLYFTASPRLKSHPHCESARYECRYF